MNEIEILTFDCYGTLIDWESGIREVLRELAARHPTNADIEGLAAEWEAIQFEMIAGPWRPYRAILRESLTATFRNHGISLDDAEAELLGDRIGNWPPFDDTVQSLRQLATRYKLAILSNIDDDILAQTVQRLQVPFDQLITAEQVKSYKPRPAHFREALRRFDRPAEQFLHCAFGYKYDMRPALEVGMATCWIQRPGFIKDDAVEPTVATQTLAGLVELLGVGG